MSYEPPLGNEVVLALFGAYTPAVGDGVPLDLADGAAPPGPPFTGVGVMQSFGVGWDAGDRRGSIRAVRWQDAPPADRAPDLSWQWGTEFDHPLAIAWSESERTDGAQSVAWQWGVPVDAKRRPEWSRPQPRDKFSRLDWDWAGERDTARGVTYRNPPPRDHARAIAWDWSTSRDRAWHARYDDPPPRDIKRLIPWGWGTPLRQQFVFIPPPVPIVDGTPPCYTPPPGHRVRLSMHGNYLPPPGNQVPLRLSCGNTREYRVQRTLIMEHTLTVCRLPDRTPLNVASVSLGIDRDSWAWTVDLQIVDRASYHLVLPDSGGPKLVEVAISGHVWTALIERATERRVAAQDGNKTPTRFAAGGRSRTAILAAPYAIAKPYISEAATTAQQAAARELEFTGFTLDWQIDDWLIPAGAWRYENETPMSAILRIAAAAGAIVQSHPEDETIIVRAAYPAAPWDWPAETPAVILDGQSLFEMGREWKPGPQYLGVYVSGETQGVLVNVIRDGSAGSPYAQMIVDPLITATEPARGRGLREIADSENQTLEPVLLPLLPSPAEPGVILPAELVQVEDPVHGLYKALSTGVSISANLVNDAISVRQNVQLARHYPVDLT